jgi:hypothetical protein
MATYCERIDASFWAEPINALSNLFFIIAALIALNVLRKSKIDNKIPSLILIINLFVIGVGSFLWHTFATPWSLIADVVPIFVFLILYVLFFVRYIIGYSYPKAWLFVGAFLLFSVVFNMLVDRELLNGTVGYLPPILFLMFLALMIRERKEVKQLILIIPVFIVSMIFRSIDFVVCDVIEIGTHFLWHFFNALFLYFLVWFFARYQNR